MGSHSHQQRNKSQLLGGTSRGYWTNCCNVPPMDSLGVHQFPSWGILGSKWPWQGWFGNYDWTPFCLSWVLHSDSRLLTTKGRWICRSATIKSVSPWEGAGFLSNGTCKIFGSTTIDYKQYKISCKYGFILWHHLWHHLPTKHIGHFSLKASLNDESAAKNCK